MAASILRNHPFLVETDSSDSELALNAYGIGLHFWRQRSRKTLHKSVGYLLDAIELDPENADAYATLADAYISLSYHYLMSPAEAGRKSEEAIRKALLLQPDSLRVRNAYINVLLNSRFDHASAEQECAVLHSAGRANERTLELHSILLGCRGRHNDSIDRALRACELAPNTHSGLVQLGSAYYYGNRQQNARNCLQQAVAMKPQSVMNHALLGRIEAIVGNWEAVLAASERVVALSGNSLLGQALEAYAYAGMDNVAPARQILCALEEWRQDECYPAYEIAAVYALLNDGEKALENLARARDHGDMKTIFISQDPALANLRVLAGFNRIATLRSTSLQ